MARNNCSALAADVALLFGRGGGTGGVYEDYWDVEEPTQKDFFLEHKLAAKFVRCNVYDVQLDREVFPDVEYTDIGKLTVHFGAAQEAGKRFKFVVTYHGEKDDSTGSGLEEG